MYVFAREEDDTIEDVIEGLEGTNQSFLVEQFSKEELDCIYSALFECAECGYWTDIDSLFYRESEELCGECYTYQYEEDY